MSAHILIIDDDQMICDMLSQKVKKLGYTAKCATTLGEAFSLSRQELFDVIYLDVHMPDGNGLDAIVSLREGPSDPEVIILTGGPEADGAKMAIQSGAWDYVSKSASIDNMVLPLVRSLQFREAKKARSPSAGFKRCNIIGSSPAISSCLDQSARAAESDANVLITGETGVGKELIAWAIHDNSARAGKNFVVVDCAALSATLVESTLFGYEKGAYTGADRTQEGLIKQADGGTLFLDEIGELPLAVQKSFLRVLQERRFRPLGGKAEVASDFRLVSATNRNLEQMVVEGTFRRDLLFRIRSLHVEIPPLRQRLGDIQELTLHFIRQFCIRKALPVKELSPEFIKCLLCYDWPGNVRELFGTLEQVMAESGKYPLLFSKHLPIDLRIKLASASFSGQDDAKICQDDSGGGDGFKKFSEVRDLAIAKMEYDYLRQLVSACGKDLKKVCELSGLSRSRFYELIKKYNVKF